MVRKHGFFIKLSSEIVFSFRSICSKFLISPSWFLQSFAVAGFTSLGEKSERSSPSMHGLQSKRWYLGSSVGLSIPCSMRSLSHTSKRKPNSSFDAARLARSVMSLYEPPSHALCMTFTASLRKCCLRYLINKSPMPPMLSSMPMKTAFLTARRFIGGGFLRVFLRDTSLGDFYQP